VAYKSTGRQLEETIAMPLLDTRRQYTQPVSCHSFGYITKRVNN